jgi:predicted Abi (CAAX) family protease
MKRHFVFIITILCLNVAPGWPAENPKIDFDCPGKGCPARAPHREYKDKGEMKDGKMEKKREPSQEDLNKKIDKSLKKDLSKELRSPSQKRF